MHHDIHHVFCDSFEILNVSQESSRDPYREGSFFRNSCKSHNSKPPKPLTNNEAMDGGMLTPKKVVQKLETQLFGGEKFGRFLIH